RDDGCTRRPARGSRGAAHRGLARRSGKHLDAGAAIGLRLHSSGAWREGALRGVACYAAAGSSHARTMVRIMTTPASDPTIIAPSEAALDDAGQPRSYEVRTFGCQMNVHDSERLSGSLESAGYVRAADGDEADVVIINTCAVRENAAGKLYGTLGHLKSRKDKHEGMQIAVGGCLAQMDKEAVQRKAPWVDVVFGTHNMGSLPRLLERSRHNEEAELEILESLEVFPSTLPTKRDSVYSGWVSISVGCNNTCTFCIVPSLRGREKDRRPGDILNEIRLLVDDGAIEVTLL